MKVIYGEGEERGGCMVMVGKEELCGGCEVMLKVTVGEGKQ